VRRNVLTHLTITGTLNLVPGLVLVSIVIDVERIGDYTKNISELARLHENPLHGGRAETELKQIEDVIEVNFPKVIEVLKGQHKQQAREVMQVEPETSKTSDKIVTNMITEQDPELSMGDAVSLAMYARYLKRVNSHLTNIASAIVNPFPRIGFREKKKQKTS